MDTLTIAIKIMSPGCYMASVDLKDAYYTVPIAKEHQKFLKFFLLKLKRCALDCF